MKIKLAEALLRRKELQEKVDLLRQVDHEALYEIQARRVKVTDNVDDLVANVPKLTASQVTREYDFYAKQLRKVDGIIQQTNWVTEIEVDGEAMSSYSAPKKEAA